MAERILLVDDDELILLSVGDLLRSGGFRIDTAPDGRAALEIADAQKFDLVVLDIVMPGMSGIEVCEALRQLEAYRQTPIVMLTAKSAPQDRERGLAAGADLFLPKPFDPGELLRLIRQAVGRT